MDTKRPKHTAMYSSKPLTAVAERAAESVVNRIPVVTLGANSGIVEPSPGADIRDDGGRSFLYTSRGALLSVLGPASRIQDIDQTAPDWRGTGLLKY